MIESELRWLFKTVHEMVKGVQCEQCSKAIGRKASLHLHIEQVHAKLRDYDCDHCDYSSSLRVISISTTIQFIGLVE